MDAMKRDAGGRFGKGNPGKPHGAVCKNAKAIKDMIIQALEDEGGVKYLRKLAKEQPVAFAGLVGKVLPMQLAGEDGGGIKIVIAKEA